MPCDPNLFPQPDDLSDDDLPEAFALLGRQLSDDAARLAALYPARDAAADEVLGAAVASAAAATSAATQRARRRRFGFAAAAAAVLAALSLTSAQIDWEREDPLLVRAPGPAGMAVEGRPATTPVAADPDHAPEVGSGVWFEEGGFESLSRPAQEALLDMFEDDVVNQNSLSI